jgi:hypothetical protein
VSNEHGTDTGDRERAALRAFLGAVEEACRSARELESLLDLLQGSERVDTIAEIFDRLEHLVELRHTLGGR